MPSDSLCFCGDGLVAHGHALESLQPGLNPGPFFRILLGVNGCVRVGVIVHDIGFEAGRNGMVGIGNQPVKELGIGVIREAISPGSNRRARIQVAVGKRLPWLAEPAQRGA